MKFKFLKTKTKLQKTREKSRGRSMVEMLGVLAIIGVLSIGGIQGYTIAMRKYRINEILNLANKYAMVIWSDIQNSEYQIDYVNQFDFNYQNSHGEEYAMWGTLAIPFSDSGLGGLPNGAKQIIFLAVVGGKSGVSVDLAIEFDDLNLCQMAKTMTDFDKNTDLYDCVSNAGWIPLSDGKNILSVRFYQD